jgi:hypothetical protein
MALPQESNLMLQQALTFTTTATPKKVFLSYCHADENIQKLLLLALRQLEHEGRISSWHDRLILPGEDWERKINRHLLSADLVLFLVSPHFLKSTYCRDIEVKTALKRAKAKKAFVIPIILAECNWKRQSFSRLLALPRDGRPLTDAAGALNARLLDDVVEGLRLAVLGLWRYSSSATKATLNNNLYNWSPPTDWRTQVRGKSV